MLAGMVAVTDDNARLRSPYEVLGGEAPLRHLVVAFCAHLEALPPGHPLRAMHAADLGPLREKLYDFLSGWLGGPDRHAGRPGAKSIDRAHAAFRIPAEAAEAWVSCMQRAISDITAPPDFEELVMPALQRMATTLARRV